MFVLCGVVLCAQMKDMLNRLKEVDKEENVSNFSCISTLLPVRAHEKEGHEHCRL